MGMLTWMLALGNGDVGDTIRFLFSIIYVCKSIVFYVFGPISLPGY